MIWGLLGCRGIGSDSGRREAAEGPADSPAGSSAIALKSASRLRVGTSGDYPPFSDWPPTASAPSGFSIDVARAYAKSLGLGIEWVRFRWPELARDLAADRFDLALSGVTVRADRSIAGRFGIPLTTSGAIVLVPATRRYQAAADLNHESVRIAVNAGGHLERVARVLFPEARIDAVPNNDAVLARLDAEPGRPGADAVVSDSLEAPLWQRKRDGLRAIGPLTRDRKAGWFPATSDGERQARRFDRWLLAFEADGGLARLRHRSGLAKVETARPVRALIATLDERLSLMNDVARSKQQSGAAVEDVARERRVLEAAGAATREAAARAGRPAPDPAIVERFFRAQIEAAKWIQQRYLEQARSGSDAGATSPALGRADLEQRIRPALLFLGERIATLVVASASPDAQHSQPSDEDIASALSRHALPAEIRSEIAASLRALLRDGTRSAPTRPRPRAGTGTAASA